MDQPQVSVQTTQPSAPSAPSANFAGVGERFVALLIDGVIIFVASFIISAFFGMLKMRALGGLLTWPLSLGYYIYFIGSTGQTLGKKVMKIKVIKMDGSQPTYIDAFLREVVGKFLSAIVIYLGFFWAIWDPQKQAWHDKIASTFVVKV